PAVAGLTRQVPFNDAQALERMLVRDDAIAAVILEPVIGNIGPILPDHGYLKDVRSITADHDVILIFDEVITGYRVGIGGAQACYGVRPDLSTFGKIIGGGLPIGAFAGRRDLMSLVAPQGPVYQAGTFSGNPLSLAAGHATLSWLHDHPEVYASMTSGTKQIQEALGERSDSFVRLGSMFKYYFRNSPPRNYREAKESDTIAFRKFWEKMKKNGIFLPPSQFETNFLSSAHDPDNISGIAEAYGKCLS
ncbi:MAG: aminotransferase class III-fold pyridoxal phosphate-dependent enzyme, partial [Methanoregulaceae archaeon]|nr:aminotransferase class III-fold pyridoxal phosphate-dependent enzyme [Methanoregulaceae archaeon]